MPVLRTRAGYNAAIMPIIPVMLPVVQQPTTKVFSSNDAAGQEDGHHALRFEPLAQRGDQENAE